MPDNRHYRASASAPVARKPRPRAALLAEARAIWEALGRRPLTLDQLAERTELPIHSVRRTVAALVEAGWPIDAIRPDAAGLRGAPARLYSIAKRSRTPLERRLKT